MSARPVALALALVVCVRAGAQEPAPPDPFAAPPDPFAAPEDPFAAPEDPFAAPPDPFAAPEDAPAPPPFDPDAVAVAPPGRGLVVPLPGELGELVLHGRANATLAHVKGRESIELLERPTSLELTSVDLYAEWFPSAWFGLLGEVEVEDDLEEEARKVEVELDLLLVEVRPLGSERLRLRAGWAPITFGLERRHYAPPRNEAVTRPAAFRRVFPGTVTDLGVSLWLTQPLGVAGRAELELGLARGLDGPGRWGRVEPFATDEDHRPQAAGRLGWTPLDLDPTRDDAPWPIRLTIGGSALEGGYEDLRGERRRIRLWGADVALRVGDLQLRGEVVGGRVEHDLAGPGGPPELLRGGYVLVCWRRELDLPGLEELLVVGRWERLDAGRLGLSPLDVERWYAGVGWGPLEGLLVKAGWEQTRSRTRAGTERAGVALVEVGYSF